MPTKKAPSKGRRYTKAEIDAINKAAPGKIDKVNEGSLNQTKKKISKAKDDAYMREYRRKLV